MNLVCSVIVNLVYRKLTIADLVSWSAWLLEVRFRNLIRAWMLVHCVCCVLCLYGPLLELITRKWVYYRQCLIVYCLESSRIRCSLGPNSAVGPQNNKVSNHQNVLIRNESPSTSFRTVCITFSCAILYLHHRSSWLGCLVTGSTVSKADKDLDVRPLCLLCVAYVGVFGTS